MENKCQTNRKRRGAYKKCVLDHRIVRELYNQRRIELGDMAKHTSKEYFLDYISEKTGYAKITIRQILNRKQKEIDQREKSL